MTPDREPRYDNEFREQILQTHDVDGIHFIVFGHHVRGSGWQGRYFRFLPSETEVMKHLLSKIPETSTRGPQESRIIINTGKDRGNISFNVHQEGGWISATDESGERHISFATTDIPALTHILGELNNLNQGNNPHGNHFCEEYGVEDDD